MAEAQTEATTNLYVPTIAEVVTSAYQRAGLLNVQQKPNVVQGAAGMRILSELSSSLAAEGVLMRAVQFGYVTLVSGQNVYSMPEDVIDIVGDGAYIDPTQSQVPFQAQAETPVVMKDRDTWQMLSAKGAQSRPYLGYFAREAPLSTLYLWPTPGVSEEGGLVRFQLHQTRPDVTNGTKTLPYERYWDSYFVFALATLLAIDNSLPLDRVQMLESNAGAKKMAAIAYSKQTTPQQAVISHATPWSRRRR